MKLSKEKYAELKERVYKIYLYDINNPGTNVIKSKREALDLKYHDDDLNKLYDNTIACPFDLELYNHLYGMSLSEENYLSTQEKFGISKKLIQDKIKEYVNYNISNINGTGSIDEAVIMELSRIYAEKQEKSNKSVAF